MLRHWPRRRHASDRLSRLLNRGNAAALSAALERCGAEEVALVMQLVPMIRAETLLCRVHRRKLRTALLHARASVHLSSHSYARLYAIVTHALAAEPLAAQTPFGLRALDIAGRLFGTLVVARDGELPPLPSRI